VRQCLCQVRLGYRSGRVVSQQPLSIPFHRVSVSQRAQHVIFWIGHHGSLS
jgi:hypothetical protein